MCERRPPKLKKSLCIFHIPHTPYTPYIPYPIYPTYPIYDLPYPMPYPMTYPMLYPMVCPVFNVFVTKWVQKKHLIMKLAAKESYGRSASFWRVPGAPNRHFWGFLAYMGVYGVWCMPRAPEGYPDLFEGVCFKLPSSWPPARVEGGPNPRLMTPDPLDPLDPLMSSRSCIFLQLLQQKWLGWCSGAMLFWRFLGMSIQGIE